MLRRAAATGVPPDESTGETAMMTTLRSTVGGWKGWCVAAVAAALTTAAWTAHADNGIKLYVFSSGALTIGKGILYNLQPLEPPIQIPVGFFLIKHPRGNVLFDTGNNDKIIT